MGTTTSKDSDAVPSAANNSTSTPGMSIDPNVANINTSPEGDEDVGKIDSFPSSPNYNHSNNINSNSHVNNDDSAFYSPEPIVGAQYTKHRDDDSVRNNSVFDDDERIVDDLAINKDKTIDHSTHEISKERSASRSLNYNTPGEDIAGMDDKLGRTSSMTSASLTRGRSLTGSRRQLIHKSPLRAESPRAVLKRKGMNAATIDVNTTVLVYFSSETKPTWREAVVMSVNVEDESIQVRYKKQKIKNQMEIEIIPLNSGRVASINWNSLILNDKIYHSTFPRASIDHEEISRSSESSEMKSIKLMSPVISATKMAATASANRRKTSVSLPSVDGDSLQSLSDSGLTDSKYEPDPRFETAYMSKPVSSANAIKQHNAYHSARDNFREEITPSKQESEKPMLGRPAASSISTSNGSITAGIVVTVSPSAAARAGNGPLITNNVTQNDINNNETKQPQKQQQDKENGNTNNNSNNNDNTANNQKEIQSAALTRSQRRKKALENLKRRFLNVFSRKSRAKILYRADKKKQQQQQQQITQVNEPDKAEVAEKKEEIVVKVPVIETKIVHCGLRNMGNTCYMNASIQCLVHAARELTQFILSGDFKNEINTLSPWSRKGEVVLEYASLVQSMTRTTLEENKTYNIIDPVSFKRKLGEWKVMFAGYRQQDSQEFLQFLLDALHEDLNRVHSKPKYPSGVWGRPNFPANKAWKLHQDRDNSIIYDLFGGMMRSTTSCRNTTDCKDISVTYEPYLMLSLAIPNISDLKLLRHLKEEKERQEKERIASLNQQQEEEEEEQQNNPKNHEKNWLIKVLLFRYNFAEGGFYTTQAINVVIQNCSEETITAQELINGIKSSSKDYSHVSMMIHMHNFPNPQSFEDMNVLKPESNLVLQKVASPIIIENNVVSYERKSDLAEQNSFSILAYELPRFRSSVMRMNSFCLMNHFGNFFIGPPLFVSTVRNILYAADLYLLFEDTLRIRIRLPSRTASYKLYFVTSEESKRGAIHLSNHIPRDDSNIIQVLSRHRTSLSDPGLRFILSWESVESVQYLLTPALGNLFFFPIDRLKNDTINGESGEFDDDHQHNNANNNYNHNNCSGQNDVTSPWKRAGYSHQVIYSPKKSPRVIDISTTLPSYKSPSTKQSPSATETKQSPQSQTSSNMQDSTVTLKDCFDIFCHEEYLEKVPSWTCPTCKQVVAPVKKIDLLHEYFPRILIVHLKRFTPTQKKIDDPVRYPIKGLNMSSLVKRAGFDTTKIDETSNNAIINGNNNSISSESKSKEELRSPRKADYDESIFHDAVAEASDDSDAIYDLCGIVFHSGTFNFGHYTTLLKCDDDKWRFFNDSSVIQLPQEDPSDCEPNAYILFYRKRI